MNLRTILGALAAMFITMSAVTAASLIWLVTAEPHLLASAQSSRDMTGLALMAVSRVLSLVW